MADDRHEAYRAMFAISGLSDLVSEFGKDFTVGLVVYRLLEVKDAHPTWPIAAIIKETRKFLEDERARVQDYKSRTSL